jgi:hypothetical protein
VTAAPKADVAPRAGDGPRSRKRLLQCAALFTNITSISASILAAVRELY